MEIEIIEKKDNPLLKREEIKFKIDHTDSQTPSREVVASKLAAMLNADKNCTVLREIRSQFGIQEALGFANLYSSEDDAKQLEPKHILIRNGIIEKEAKK